MGAGPAHVQQVRSPRAKFLHGTTSTPERSTRKLKSNASVHEDMAKAVIMEVFVLKNLLALCGHKLIE